MLKKNNVLMFSALVTLFGWTGGIQMFKMNK